jgi:hypothetical protein
VRTRAARVRKAGDGGLAVAEDPLGGGWIQPFDERRQHHCDLLGGRFQAVQGSVAPSSERATAGLTTKGLDPFNKTMLAIPKEAHA